VRYTTEITTTHRGFEVRAGHETLRLWTIEEVLDVMRLRMQRTREILEISRRCE